MPGSRRGRRARPSKSRGAWGLRDQGVAAGVARRVGPSPFTLRHELRLDQLRNAAGGGAGGEKPAQGRAPARAEIERPIVDVHADEGVSLKLVKATAELQRVVERWLAMGQAIFDALLQQAVNIANGRFAE